jgi:small conductance mechanosensitive channel
MNGDSGSFRMVSIAVVLLALTGLAWPGPAASQPPAPIVDPATPVDQLALRLTPLTQEDLAAEAKAWLAIAKARTQDAVDAKLQLQAAGAAGAKAAEQKSTEAVSARFAAFERFAAVLAAWEAKGGDPKVIAEYRQYIASVRGQGIKTIGVSTAWTLLSQWLVAPEGGIRFGVRIVLLAVAVLLLLFVAKLASAAVGRSVSRVPDVSHLFKNFLTRAVYWLTFAIGIAIALSFMGVNMGPVLALIGGGSFIAAFALQNTLSNFAAGLMIMIYKPFDVGHVVTLGGITGTVKEVSLVSTTLLTPDNQTVVIPNGSVWNSIITNISASGTRRVDLTFAIAYDADPEAARRILDEIVAAHPLVLRDPESVVRMHQLADSSVNFVCRPWTKSDDYWTVYWEITQQVKARFDAAGITIPFPQRDVHVYTHTASS